MKLKPDSYNFGVNIGKRWTNYLPCSFHLIPRYKGDDENLEGGMRNVIPTKGKYVGKPAENVDEVYEMLKS
ncbi:MAG: hypothetical protein J7K98_02370 [Candidatus Aenigmarchaeota archaeon]|nr:hypothetical protein [Candidatus Aenigmarchaeota archaeon]